MKAFENLRVIHDNSDIRKDYLSAMFKFKKLGLLNKLFIFSSEEKNCSVLLHCIEKTNNCSFDP